MDHDRLFKELLSTFFVDFLELFFPEVATALDASSIEFLEQEVFTDVTAGSRLEADLVVRAKFNDRPSCFLIHVEHQAQPRAAFANRMFKYFARLYEKHGLPVYPIAVFSYDAPARLEPDEYRIQVADHEILSFRFRVVQLNQLDWRDFLDRADPIVAALMARMRMQPHERPLVKLSCLKMLANLQLDPARTQLISGFVDSYLELTMSEEQTFDAELAATGAHEQEQVMEIVTSWMRQGIEQGLEQGRSEGREQGRTEGRQTEAATLVQRQLTKRCGPLAADLESQVQQLSTEQLENLAEALLDFEDVSDLNAWLDDSA